MKTTVMTKSFFSTVALCAFALAARAADPTAFDLIKEGNRYVGEDAKDKVVQIRSEKSIGGLTPSTWWIVFYDIDARMKATEVRFDGGKKTDVQRPFRLFERAGSYKNLLDRSKLKIDSTEALKIAQKDGLLDRVKLTNSKLQLERWEDMPVWKVTFWAEKARNASQTVDVGQIFVNAEDGKVVHRDLHINRVD
ncbi:MAG TPA: hypothetical protein VK530_13980 [Candidatus Acidoferrum sp.]|nr:hypothetical protein [Candidatus Acidoferrum sp.]